MRETKCLINVKRVLILTSFFFFVLPAFSSQILFEPRPSKMGRGENVVIDEDAMGHREIGDIDGDGFNDMAAVNTAKSEHLIV